MRHNARAFAGQQEVEVALKEIPTILPEPSIIVEVDDTPPGLDLAQIGESAYQQELQDNGNGTVRVVTGLGSTSIGGLPAKEFTTTNADYERWTGVAFYDGLTYEIILASLTPQFAGAQGAWRAFMASWHWR